MLDPLVIFFDTGSGANRRLLNISDIAQDLGHRYCEALLGIYCFTGEDCNCAFKGKGKTMPIKKMDKKPRYQEFFARLGDGWVVHDEVVDGLEQFVCYLYGYPRVKRVNEVRGLMLKKMVGDDESITRKSKVDLSWLPPCKQSLIPHIKRANYRVAQWTMANIAMPEVPPPIEHGWIRHPGELIEPVWTEGPVLPTCLEDILQHQVEESTSEDESQEDDIINSDSDISDIEDMHGQ